MAKGAIILEDIEGVGLQIKVDFYGEPASDSIAHIAIQNMSHKLLEIIEKVRREIENKQDLH